MSLTSTVSQTVGGTLRSGVSDPGGSRAVQNALRDALKTLDYGSIVITVHNGDVEQIDVIKKTRPFRSPQSRR